MNIFEKILVFLDGNMERPNSYGLFHIIWLIIMIAAIILIIKKYRNNVDKGKKIILILSIMCLLFELYKQLNFSFNYSDTKTWWEYQWYAFPFQFCSTPMYIGLIASIIKNEKIKNSLYYFLATYGLLGGLITMIYPETCFVTTIGINIQTMFHHGSMVVMGICAITCLKLKFDFKSFMSATKVFISLVLIAIITNIITYYIGIDNGLELFYISPFHNSQLPIFSLIDEKSPYLLFLIIYLLLFSLTCLGIITLVGKIKKIKNN